MPEPITQAKKPKANEPEAISDATRRSNLATAVNREVATGGHVESQTGYNALVRHGNRPNHVLHLILTLVTLGFWLWVWIAIVIFHHATKKTVSISVDEFGNVNKQRL